MSCCPPGSWGELKPDTDYQQKGTVENLGDLPVYVTGTSDRFKCVLWNYDIFGFNGGRTRQLCDVLGDQGYLVVLPDFYRGQWRSPTDDDVADFIKKETKWEKIKVDWDRIIEFAKGKGSKVFGTVGTCWGSTLALKLSAYPEFVAAACMHPAHSQIVQLIEEEEETLLKNAKSAKHMFMPAGDDMDNVKPGGLAEKILGDQLKIHLFEDMKHGWTARGDMSVANVKRDVNKAVDCMLHHFKENLRE